MQVFENCLKAYIHQGRAHLGLKQYTEAVQSYERALKIDPTKEKVIAGKLGTFTGKLVRGWGCV